MSLLTLGWGFVISHRICIDGTYSSTGGSQLMLQWLDEVVIPAVLAKLGEGRSVARGEVSITGGSVGGLTPCYAAVAMI